MKTIKKQLEEAISSEVNTYYRIQIAKNVSKKLQVFLGNVLWFDLNACLWDMRVKWKELIKSY